MQQKSVKKLDTEKLIFGITVWIFLSLNAKAFNFSFYTILRWILPVVLAVFAFSKREGKIPYPPSIIVLFILAIIPSFFVTLDEVESATKAISFVLIVYGFYVCFWGAKDRQELEEYFKIMCIAILIFQAFNIIYCLIGRGGGVNDRYNGFTTNPNTLGIYSNLALWAAYYFYVKAKNWKKQLIFVFMFIASIVLALLSGSRTAFIIVLLNTIVVVFIKAKTNLTKLTVALIIGAFLILLFTGSLGFLEITALDRLLLEDGTKRSELWDYAIEVWKERPCFGCGYKVSKFYNEIPGNEGMDFHNSYISILLEVGIWGVVLIGFAMLPSLFQAIKQTGKEIKLNKNSCFLPVAFMVVSLLISAWSESFLFSVGSTEAAIFWMLFVWILNYLKKSEVKNEQNGSVNVLVRHV